MYGRLDVTRSKRVKDAYLDSTTCDSAAHGFLKFIDKPSLFFGSM
jgi:hypothetical protein